MTTDDELRAELDELAPRRKKKQGTAREERIVAGFEEIQRFVEENGRPPGHGEDKGIFERLYAVRLARLRSLSDCRELLADMDHQGLLKMDSASESDSLDAISDDELLAQLGASRNEANDVTKLRYVRPRSEVQTPEEIASREPSKEFDQFQPLFEQVQRELKAGIRETVRFGRDTTVNEGEFFIIGGQLAYVAHVGETLKISKGKKDARLRVIYSNGTESNLLLRSLQRALYKDEAGRRVTDPDAGPLFSGGKEEGDVQSGTIYVLRSWSNVPDVAENRELIHKIGVTGGKVETRIANATNEATYLLAEVEVVATYKLVGINRVKLENLLHRVFAPAQLDLTIPDRFGNPVHPHEWFLVPLSAIAKAVEMIRDGSITNYVYDPNVADFVEKDDG